MNKFGTIFPSGILFLSAIFCYVSVQSIPARAQQIAELTEDEKQAMNLITQRTNTATLSFLASDALKGRGTGSRGFDIACAYVASRFQAAGLQGPRGDEGSYYQYAMLSMSKAPASGWSIADENGNQAIVYGLWNGGKEEFRFEGKVQAQDEDDTQQTFQGPVAIKEPVANAAGGRRRRPSLEQIARRLQARGATALIVPVSANSPLVKQLKERAARPRLRNARSSTDLPIVLVSADTDIDSLQTFSIPAEIKSVQKTANVIGILPGSDDTMKDQAIIVSAHLDHLGQRNNGSDDQIYNGADDNASGVTGTLALADAFAALKNHPKRTMIFVAYWGEERGLLGSRHMVENPIWPLDKIVANVNIEMIGRPEPGANGKAWVTGWEHSNLGELMNVASQRAGVEIFEHPRFSAQLYRASDNWPLVQAGVIAHSISAGSLHSDYHQPSDEWEKLNMRHLTLVCKGLFAGTLPLASGEVTPQPRESQ